ncbi:PAS domain-containing protein [Legionella maceachernii]|uniref:PAS fold protein n=1 Tax=Legionella maceachernii TaxID=466 RepID=A0A0W0VXZ3_9GAMM|nr:PAS domain-containing protein [Legionella maceachernii]KTD24899.1 PAS fold protein [Legionella maceachernii]SKA16114.1 PAS domain-containing protein [Legionella maceachernii]SUP01604.1 Response regulator [Legionella maceachernii]
MGRPISHIVSNLQYDNLLHDAREVLHTLKPKSTEVQDKSDHWCVVRIIPYRTINNVIDGVVLTFINIHSQKMAENRLAALEEELKGLKNTEYALLNALDDLVVIINKDKQILFANDKFLSVFSLDRTKIINEPIFNLKIEWHIKNLDHLIDETLKGSESLLNREADIIPNRPNVVSMKYSRSMVLIYFKSK